MRLPVSPVATLRLLSLLLPAALLAAAGCNRSSGRATGAAGNLRLNEVMASNDSVPVTDASGAAVVQDWVEIHNPSATGVSLTGYSLTDDLGQPRKFEFPPGLMLPGGGFLIVFLFNAENCLSDCNAAHLECRDEAGEDAAQLAECDADLAACRARCSPAGLTAGFGLSASSPEGETLYLFSGDGGALVDRIGIRQPPPDVASGRYPDATGKYDVIFLPTPGALNKPTGIKAPSVQSAAASGGTAEGEPVTLTFDVKADAPSDPAIQEAQGELSVLVEYADIEPPAGGGPRVCPPPPAVVDGLPFVSVPAVPGGVREDVDTRLDIEHRPVEMPVRIGSYTAELPPAACGTLRFIRITAEDGLGVGTSSQCFPYCETFKVVVNEYVPNNTKLAFERTNPSGEKFVVRPDWIEIRNYGDVDLDLGQFVLAGLNAYTNPDFDVERNRLASLGGPTAPDSFPLPAGGYIAVLADNRPQNSYRLLTGDPNRVYVSTRFGLDAAPDDLGNPDGFVLLSPSGRSLDIVVLDFAGTNTPIADDQAAARIPESDTRPNILMPGVVTDCPTFEGPNVEVCDLAPLFEEPVTVEPRCPAAGQVVTVRARVNFDEDTPPEEAHVTFLPKVGGKPLAGAALVMERAESQVDAAAAMVLYDLTATVPGQPAGTLVVFSFEANDLELQKTATHSEEEVRGEEVSFRYLHGYAPAADAPRLSEAMPCNQSIILPPFAGLPAEEIRYPDYLEIFNPGTAAIDLEGHYLTHEPLPDAPIRRARLWRFPPESIVGPGANLILYFGPPPLRDPPLAPPEYVEVTGFNLDRTEALYLIAPDEEGNCVVDSLRWDFLTDAACDDQAIGRFFCDGVNDNAVELALPTPGAPNALDPIVEVAFHQPISSVEVNGCVPENEFFVQLTTVVFADDALAMLLGPGGTVGSPEYVIDRGRGEETFRAQLQPVPPCSTGGQATPCAFPPPGYRNIGLGLSLQPPYAPVVQYRVRFNAACGGAFESQTFTFGSAGAERPDVAINEANRFFLVPGQTQARPWLELFNRSDVPVDLGGMFLSDERFDPRKAELPAGLTIAPRGFLVVFTDELGFDFGPVPPPPLPGMPPPHAPPLAGTFFLTDTVERGTCVVDAFDYDFRVSPDDSTTSLGRDPDGGEEIRLLDAPSPGRSNTQAVFIRGDANDSGGVNITDMIFTVEALFPESPLEPRCEDALDSNDDGLLNLTDVTNTGNFLFLGGPRPPPPFPDPGPDPTADGLSCQ